MSERKKGDILTKEEEQAAVDMANMIARFSARYDVGVTFVAISLVIANNAEDRDEVEHMIDFIEGITQDLFDDVKRGQA